MTIFREGHYINFSVDLGAARKDKRDLETIRSTKSLNTVAKLAGRRGHPEDARLIADLNYLKTNGNVNHKLKPGTTIKVPREVKAQGLRVLCGDAAPTPSAGYAKFDTIDRPQRTGISVFSGYDPFVLTIAVRFESVTASPGGEREGQDIESDIRTLEGMAGRGIESKHHGSGPPPFLRVSVTEGGNVVPLIPINYQFHPKLNTQAPLWQISGLDWDDTPWRNNSGNRIRQLATVELTEYVEATIKSLSATQRAANR